MKRRLSSTIRRIMRLVPWIAVILWSTVSLPLASQGLLLDDAAYDALQRLPNYGEKSGEKLLQNTPKVDLRPFCPRPQDQGAIGSCTGWSTGYGAMSIMQAMQNGWKGQTDKITQHALSALYLYNQVKIGSCEGGAYIDKAVALAKTEGSVRSAEFDQFKNDCTTMPTVADSLAALPNRIKDYMTLFGSREAGAVKVEKVRLSLAQHKPVVIGMMLRRNFQACRAESPYWTPELGDTTFMGAHAMVVVGYDDGRQAFEILNSWGERWGNGGFIWVKYNDFARFVSYAIQLIPKARTVNNDATQPIRWPLSSALTADVPVYQPDNSLGFRPASFHRPGAYYSAPTGAWDAGAMLRWHLSRVTADSYLYAFSYAPNGSINIHWPRDGALDDKYAGTKESAIITLANPDLYLPGEYGALRFGQPGTEYVCFLFSRAPINDFNEALQRFRAGRSTDLFARLRAGFGHRLAPPDRIAYDQNEVAFEARVGETEIVPLIVRFAVN